MSGDWRKDVPREDRERLVVEIPESSADLIDTEAARESVPAWKIVHKCVQTALGDESRLRQKKQRLEARLSEIEEEQDELQDELETIESQIESQSPDPYEQQVVEWGEWHVENPSVPINTEIKSVRDLTQTYDVDGERVVADLEKVVQELQDGDSA